MIWFTPCLVPYAWASPGNYFAQKISEQQMQVVPALRGSRLINDRCGPAVFPAQAPDTVKHYVYVDNLRVLGGDPSVLTRV